MRINKQQTLGKPRVASNLPARSYQNMIYEFVLLFCLPSTYGHSDNCRAIRVVLTRDWPAFQWRCINMAASSLKGAHYLIHNFDILLCHLLAPPLHREIG